MNEAALQFLNEHQTYAIIGLSDNPKRYSNKIYKKLIEKGKTVYGVNPVYDIVEGQTVYDKLSEINDTIDVVILIVNPELGINYLHEAFTLGIKNLWLQPGAISEDIMEKAKFLNLNVIKECVLAVYNYEDY